MMAMSTRARTKRLASRLAASDLSSPLTLAQKSRGKKSSVLNERDGVTLSSFPHAARSREERPVNRPTRKGRTSMSGNAKNKILDDSGRGYDINSDISGEKTHPPQQHIINSTQKDSDKSEEALPDSYLPTPTTLKSKRSSTDSKMIKMEPTTRSVEELPHNMGNIRDSEAGPLRKRTKQESPTKSMQPLIPSKLIVPSILPVSYILLAYCSFYFDVSSNLTNYWT
jgi:hypothetical protein